MINGNITQRGGVTGGLTAGVGGTTDYNELENRPSINGNILEGNKTGQQLGLLEWGSVIANPDVTGQAIRPLNYIEIKGEYYKPPEQPIYNILTDDIILWTNPTLTVISGNITLSDKLKNYDYFYFDYFSPNDGQNYTQSAQTPLYPIPKSNNDDFIHEGSWSIYPTYGNRSLDCYCDDLNSYNMYLFGSGQWDWPLILYRIHGVNHRIGVIV